MISARHESALDTHTHTLRTESPQSSTDAGVINSPSNKTTDAPTFFVCPFLPVAQRHDYNVCK